MSRTVNPNSTHVPRAAAARAFALPDLLAAIAAAFILAMLALPASGDQRRASRAVLCLANLRQLAAAHELYAQDNNDLFAENYTGGDAMAGAAGRDPRKSPWASGWLDWGGSADNTNMALVRERAFARLGPYLRSEQNVHKCPADYHLSTMQRQRGVKQRVRSLSLNATIGGGNVLVGPWSPEYMQVRSRRDLSAGRTPASQAMTFADEHPDSINDPVLYPPNAGGWVDLPASFHHGAGSVAFADGRVELHSWRGSARGARIRVSGFSSPNAPPNDPDVAWLRDRSARR